MKVKIKQDTCLYSVIYKTGISKGKLGISSIEAYSEQEAIMTFINDNSDLNITSIQASSI